MSNAGRPTKYSEELINEICRRARTRSINAVAQDEDMPCQATIYNWLAENPEFLENYESARRTRAFARAESLDETLQELRSGQIDAAQARVIMDAIKWQCGRENPKFSDKVDHVSSDGSMSPVKSIEGFTLVPLTNK